MKVCMFVTTNMTHDARVAREARTLAHAGHDVTVLCVRSSPDLPASERIDGFAIERFEIGGRVRAAARAALGASQAAGGPYAGPAANSAPRRGGFVRSTVVKLGRTLSALSFARAAAKRAAELKPDVYHCHDFDTLVAGWLARRKHTAKIVYDSHEIYAYLNVERPFPGRRATVEAFERLAFKRAGAVIVVSEAFADHFVRRFGIARPTVVMNVPETQPPHDVAVPDVLRNGVPVAIYVGGIQRARGLEEVIDALAFTPEIRFVVIGPSFPGTVERLELQARNAGVADRVTFLPPVPHADLVQLASHASVAVVPFQRTCLSHELTLPNKLFEAFHSGLPVLASDFPELRRVVTETGAGRLCDTSQPKEIARTLEEIVFGPHHDEMRAAARRAAGTYTWEREAAKLVAVYERLGATG